LRRFLFGAPLHTSLTENQVRLLATRAAQKARIPAVLGLVIVRRIKSRIVWIASTPTAGSGWSVSIDDGTGATGQVKRWGVR